MKSKDTSQKEAIDFDRLPLNTLVLVGATSHEYTYRRYFKRLDESGKPICFGSGCTSNSASMGACSQGETAECIRLLENPPVPWFGGDCPLPDNVMIKYWTRGAGGLGDFRCRVQDIGRRGCQGVWDRSYSDRDIIAFQILESGWYDFSPQYKLLMMRDVD